MVRLLDQLSNNFDNWEFIKENEGIKRHHKAISSYSLPIIQSEAVIQGHEFTTA
ncbi:hypothetical protein PS15m_007787 [Mucor circinelloides]